MSKQGIGNMELAPGVRVFFDKLISKEPTIGNYSLLSNREVFSKVADEQELRTLFDNYFDSRAMQLYEIGRSSENLEQAKDFVISISDEGVGIDFRNYERQYLVKYSDALDLTAKYGTSDEYIMSLDNVLSEIAIKIMQGLRNKEEIVIMKKNRTKFTQITTSTGMKKKVFSFAVDGVTLVEELQELAVINHVDVYLSNPKTNQTYTIPLLEKVDMSKVYQCMERVGKRDSTGVYTQINIG